MLPSIEHLRFSDLWLALKVKLKKNYSIWDYSLLKLYGTILGLVVGAFFPELVKAVLIPLIVVFVCLGTYFLYLLLKQD